MRRVAIVASHPIQYQAPWFRALAERTDLTVFFCHRQDANGQARAGFDVPFDWDVPLVDGYRHHWLSNVASEPGVDRFGGCDTPELSERLAGGNFDVCIVCGWYLKSYLQAIRAARRLGLPVLVRGDSQLTTARNRITRIAKVLPYRWLLARIDAHLYVGRRNHEYLQHYGVRPERLFFAPHFVDNDRFSSEAARARQSGEAQRLRAAWGASESTSVFLFAGKFLPRKRVGDFIDAVLSLGRAGQNVTGVIVGSGPEEPALRARAAGNDHIRFDGFQNQSQMPARYAAADCLVLPSDASETWGLVVNEAMAAGLPAVVSDAVGCGPDLIDHGQTGFVFPVGDVSALVSRLGDIRQLRNTNADLVRHAVLRKIERYSCDTALSGTMAAISSVTAKSAPKHAEAQNSHA
jgi:glycosyltransferase involved in cell wall biosynthesis